MIVLVCGGRDYEDDDHVDRVLSAIHAEQRISLIVHGDSRGADRCADRWGTSMGVHVARMPALWEAYGRGAGPRRNTAMLLLRVELVIAFPGGTGTADMVRQARRARIRVMEVTP